MTAFLNYFSPSFFQYLDREERHYQDQRLRYFPRLGRRAVHVHVIRWHRGLDGARGHPERALQREGGHLVLRGLSLGTADVRGAL